MAAEVTHNAQSEKTGAFTKLRDGIYRFPSAIEGPHGHVNGYLVETPYCNVLIDPPADLTQAAVDAVSEKGAVRHILVTHLQTENVAGCVNFPQARVHLSSGDEYLAFGPQAYARLDNRWLPPWGWESRGNYRGHVAGARNERPAPVALSLGEPLVPGEAILGFNVIATPGHGKAAVTITIEQGGERIAFSGDLIVGDGQMWNWFDSEWDYGRQLGQQWVQASARKLADCDISLLCPTHGPVIDTPDYALRNLASRISAVLKPVSSESISLNTDELPAMAEGFRRILPHLHQYACDHGNLAVLVSDTGNALLIDDGLCCWKPLDERAANHERVIKDMKRGLGIDRIEMLIITHYHGDHLENIPDLVANEGAEVVCLDSVAEVVMYPSRFNLCCPLPWYETRHDTVNVDRVVQDGQHIKWREYDLEIFNLGGQTRYHAGIEVVVDEKRVAFIGDAISLNVQAEAPVCYNDAEPGTDGWAAATRRLLDREPDVLVAGHAEFCHNPASMLKRKQMNWAMRLQQFDALDYRGDRQLFFNPFSSR